MSRADFHFSKNFSNSQGFEHDFEGFSDVWKSIDDISSLSFELLLPKENLINKQEATDNEGGLGKNIFAIEELMMRQNLVNLAINENMTVRENKNKTYVDLLVKCDKDIYTGEFKEKLAEMTEDDVNFFELIANKQNIFINTSNSLLLEDESGQTVLRDLKFSKSMVNLIEYAHSSNRPIRIDFAKDLSVILRIDKQGRVSAEFISSDNAMEFLLKTNIPHLKQKLDSAGIKYKKIYYKDEEEE
ncbi:MAG: hypothetical protein WCF95_05005 [bacterium]